MIVSAGLTNTTLVPRIGNPTELVIVEVEHKETSGECPEGSESLFFCAVWLWLIICCSGACFNHLCDYMIELGGVLTCDNRPSKPLFKIFSCITGNGATGLTFAVFGGFQFQLVTISNLLITLILETLFKYFPIIVRVGTLGKYADNVNDREKPFFRFRVPSGTDRLIFKELKTFCALMRTPPKRAIEC